MPEINLPTAAKQDSIKQTVESIASNFPLEIRGGMDFSQVVPFLHSNSTTSSTEQLVCNIMGKGIITGHTHTGGGIASIIYTRLIIDGIETTVPFGAQENYGWLPFNESVVAYIKGSTGVNRTCTIQGFLY